MSEYLPSADALRYLQEKHGITRSHGTLHAWQRQGTLKADRYDGRFRTYMPETLDKFAEKHFRTSSPESEGIPMGRVSRRNSFGDAGATATERRNSKAPLAKGGRNADVGEQNADVQRPGHTGKTSNARGPGKQSTLGGWAAQATDRASDKVPRPSRAERAMQQAANLALPVSMAAKRGACGNDLHVAR